MSNPDHEWLEKVAATTNDTAAALREFTARRDREKRSVQALNRAAGTLDLAADSIRHAQDRLRAEQELPTPGLYQCVGVMRFGDGKTTPWGGRLLYESSTSGSIVYNEDCLTFAAEPGWGMITLPGDIQLLLHTTTPVDVSYVRLESLWRTGPGNHVYEVCELWHEAPARAMLRLKYKAQGVVCSPLIEITRSLSELVFFHEQVTDLQRVET
jgi:hypothetical protein